MALGGFADKIFEVSMQKIYTFDEFSNEIGLNVEEQEVDGDKPSTYIKGMNLENPSIALDLRQSTNLDVETEINDWRKLCNDSTPYMLFIGNNPVSVNKYLLTGVSVSDSTIISSGKIVRCKLKLSFKEYVRAGVKKEEGTSSSSKKSASSSSKKKSSSETSEMSDEDASKTSELEEWIGG